MQKKSNRWLFTKLFDYTDFRTKAVYRYSEEIAQLSQSEKNEVYRDIRAQIYNMTEFYISKNVDINNLVGAVLSDIYRTMNAALYYTQEQNDYLSNTVKVFFETLRKHGICVHFGTNNRFDNEEAVVRLFPLFLKACGFITFDAFTAIQLLGLAGEKRRIDYMDILSKNKKKVLLAVNDIVAEANKDKINYVVILPDFELSDFAEMLSTIGKPGYLNFFQQENSDSSRIATFPYAL